MFCSECGSKIIDDAKFCNSCGSNKTYHNQSIFNNIDDRKKAWGKWLTLFIPSFSAFVFANHYFGFEVVFPILIIMLITTLLYQRNFKGRSWHSILWGKEKD